MTISVEIIEDSIARSGKRLTTFLLRYPRIIHADFMTHRLFSRNGSSSRAIPILTMLRNTVRDMALPVEYGSNKPGMQAGAPLTGLRAWVVDKIWRTTGRFVVGAAWLMHKAGVHKQIANRMVEPWTHMTVVVTATEWANFWALRNHKDADPTLQALAREMHYQYDTNVPKYLARGQWHLPFVTSEEREELSIEDQLLLSACRCASTSYNKVGSDELMTVEVARKIWVKLIESKPMHASPVEHQGTPARHGTTWSGNFQGFTQFRKTLPGEAVW